jgi:glycosyltransferase involved in cell wall biosynthesis
MNTVKRVLYIGEYYEDYTRNYIFINGLKQNQVEVHEINLNRMKKIKRIKTLLSNFKKLKNANFDVLIFFSIMTSPISYFMAKAYAYIKKIPFIYDIFISKHLTYYYDRKLSNVKKTIKLKSYYWIYYYLLDFFECHFSNYILLDTNSHIKYFHEKYNVPLRKFRRIFVGARDDIFIPQNIHKKKENKFIVGYWGTYIPLHGVDYIIKAFELLKNEGDIYLSLLGDGQTYEASLELAKRLNIRNIEFNPKVFFARRELNKLPEFIAKFDIGLGLFGKSQKVLLAIPNKVFEGMAMRIPMITSKSPAISELLTENENIITCEQAKPESLAKAIMLLKNDENLRNEIKENAYSLFRKHCTIEEIGKFLTEILNEIMNL